MGLEISFILEVAHHLEIKIELEVMVRRGILRGCRITRHNGIGSFTL